jgi:hypothetical protein
MPYAPMPYAPMPHALCARPSAPCPMPPCPMPYALSIVDLGLRISDLKASASIINFDPCRNCLRIKAVTGGDKPRHYYGRAGIAGRDKPPSLHQKTVEGRNIQNSEPQNRRMSKGGFAAFSLFIKSTEYIPSTFDIRHSAVLRFAFLALRPMPHALTFTPVGIVCELKLLQAGIRPTVNN